MVMLMVWFEQMCTIGMCNTIIKGRWEGWELDQSFSRALKEKAGFQVSSEGGGKGWAGGGKKVTLFVIWLLRGAFKKFLDSLYYSELELCGGAVKVSFLKYLPWQVMHFLQQSTHFLKMCCRLLITSELLASELPFYGWKSPKIAWGKIWTVWWMF
jgi:hypothetical protein